ncbi:hypothetical protein [Kangiella sediminilitoris]|uniref:Uncharacterized protein n=1 Tax=Kangiella sediminilitoris TaxID=1144748 RepID=A0A1B3B7K0_9GAMM|nr:hypothetical protein [Kangiella sediminilitoris]AOE48770.1 hypothetical protein KS2013_38 [Kangiella sediminilitoris]
MNKKLSEELKDVEDIDLDKPSFEELCKKNHPGQWKTLTALMWLIFVGFVSVSIFNNYMNSSDAKSIIANNSEVVASVIDTNQILEDGKYTDYSVDLELMVDGARKTLNLEIPEDTFEENYKGAEELKIIYSGPEEYNLKSYYERKSNMFSNWISILFGYIIVFVLLFIGRHYSLKMLCGKEGV